MSALLKAIGVYLAVVVPLVAWIGGSIWAAAAGDDGLSVIILSAPIWLAVIGGAVYGIIIRPIANLFDYYKQKEARK